MWTVSPDVLYLFEGELQSVVRPCAESRSSFSSPGSAGSTAGLHLRKLGAEPDIHRGQTMRRGVGLCLLGLLCLHSWVFGQEPVGDQPSAHVFCDDPSAERAVHSAVHKFNERLSTGYKIALFQIQSAVKSENGSGSVYSLHFTARRSDCPAGSSKPWTDCDYLPFGRKRPISCNATVHVTETETDTMQVDCLLDDYIIPEKASCLGCPVEIDENSEDLKVPLTVSISKYNAISESNHLFTLHRVGHATRQVVAGFRFKLRFDMKKTTCTKAEHKDLSELCPSDEQDVEFTNCNSTVDVAPWRLEPPEAQLECEAGALPSTLFRRRPPGWSPLRNLLYNVLPTTVRPFPPSHSPSKAPAKEESSEEDTATSKPSASPDVASGADNPLHCPSKPWKPFHPALPPKAPTMATVELSAAEALKDTDLLA
ncbi:kininogen-1 isoform X2 [Xiphias gladius]|uniref:kininogen-1 isoform X2 n=1 Tax=Xiphias gladius TaxID=8245 RepID=UPI001A998F8B|nr:kininogen-1 isoform X2 [Xiphias gladius]